MGQRASFSLMIVGLISLVACPWFVSGYPLFVLTMICIYSMAAVGLNLLSGYCGQTSFGHSGFYAIGAYTASILASRLHLPFLPSLVAAVVVSGLVGAGLAVPALRLKGLSLAITTFGFGVVVQVGIVALEGITGGVSGLIVPRVKAFLPRPIQLYYMALVAVVLLVYVASSLVRSRTGRGWLAVRGSETAARAVGVDVTYYKVLAFALSAAFTGLAGVLYAQVADYISAEAFDSSLSISFFAMVIVGGLASIPGSILGAIFFVLLPEVLRATRDTQQIIFGVLMVLTMMLMPEGLMGVLNRLQRWLRARAPGRRTASADGTEEGAAL